MKPYTYLIRFKPTGQVYYGSRFKNVRLNRTAEDDLMLHYFTSSKYIKEMIKQYGIESFEWEVRRKFESVKAASAWEVKVLRRVKVLEKQDKWLNKNIAGHIPATKESCKKISDFHKGKPKSDTHKQNIRLANKGKPKEYTRTEKYRKDMSILKTGAGNAMYGKPCSEERAKNISAAKKGKPAHNKGVPMTEEQKANIRATKKANPHVKTPEEIAKRAAKVLGQKRTDEQKENIRQGVLRRNAERNAKVARQQL